MKIALALLLHCGLAFSFTQTTKYLHGKATITDPAGKELRKYQVLIKAEQSEKSIESTIIRFDDNMKGKVYHEKLHRLNADTAAIINLDSGGASRKVQLKSEGKDFRGLFGTVPLPKGGQKKVDITVTGEGATETTDFLTQDFDAAGKLLNKNHTVARALTKAEYEAFVKKITVIGKAR